MAAKEKWNLGAYISDLKFHPYMEGKISVEHRSNNPKRDYLFLNQIQGKHYPTHHSYTHKMCLELADMVGDKVKSSGSGGSKHILVIGFAETATALGKEVAGSIVVSSGYNVSYMQSTREECSQEGVIKVLGFEESHSHATSHNLYFDTTKHKSFSEFLSGIDFIIFVDDEITTGSTIRNLADEISHYGYSNGYIAASICNWMNEENTAKMSNKGIGTCSLVSGVIRDSNLKMNVEVLGEDGGVTYQSLLKGNNKNIQISPMVLRFNTDLAWKSRLNIDSFEAYFYETCDILNRVALEVNDCMHLDRLKKTLVIGTEEFMWEPMRLAYILNNLNSTEDTNTFFQATTISPIDVTSDRNSSINSRHSIISNSGGAGYIYNMDKYNNVIVVFDREPSEEAKDSILNVLMGAGNRVRDIVYVIL